MSTIKGRQAIRDHIQRTAAIVAAEDVVLYAWPPRKRKAVQRARHRLDVLRTRNARPRRIKRAQKQLARRVYVEAKRPKKVETW